MSSPTKLEEREGLEPSGALPGPLRLSGALL